MVDVYFTYENGACDQFTNDAGKKETVAIVIAPLRVEGIETDKLKVITGCNMWQGCFNENCYYSSAARSKPQIKKESK